MLQRPPPGRRVAAPLEAQRAWDPAELSAELAALSEEQRALLAEAIARGPEADPYALRWTAARTGQVARLAAELPWLSIGPDHAPVLRFELGAYDILAAGLRGLPRLARRKLTPPSPDLDALSQAPSELALALRELAARGGFCPLASLSEAAARVLGRKSSSASPFLSVGRSPALPSRDRQRGPWALLSPEAFAALAPPPPRPERWIPACPWLSLAIAALAGAARRGELAGRGPRRRGLALAAALLPTAEACFPPAELERAELAWEAALRAELIDSRGEPGPTLEIFLIERPLNRLRRILAGAARALGLVDFHEEVAALGQAALVFLADHPRPMALDGPLRGGLLAHIRARIGGEQEAEDLGGWGTEDLAAAAWPLTAPLLEALGLAAIARDHLGAPCSLTSTPFLRGLLAPEERPSLQVQGDEARVALAEKSLGPALGLALLGGLRREERGAALRLSRAALLARGRPAAEAALGELVAPQAARAWLGAGPIARARSWFVVEVSSAELADALAAHPVMEGRLLDRVTPTVLLLFGPDSLDEPLRQVFDELGIALEG